MTLGQRIQEYRLGLGLSQAELGERLGVSRQAVSRWEADGAVPDTDKLIALSRLFCLTLNELLQVESTPAPTVADKEEEEETAVLPEPQGRRPSPHWKSLLLAAACLLIGLGVGLALLTGRMAELEGRVVALEARVQPLDPADLIAAWNVGLGERRMLNGRLCFSISVQITTTQYDADEPLEVFFRLTGDNVKPARAEAELVLGAGGMYTAELPVDGVGPALLSAGFKQDSVEYLQPLARLDSVQEDGMSYTPLWPVE